MKTSEILQKARDVITPPGSWCKGQMHILDVTHCALGALDVVLFNSKMQVNDKTPGVEALANTIPADFAPPHFLQCYWKAGYPASEVAIYNNANDQQTVLAWFDRAIARQKMLEDMQEVQPEVQVVDLRPLIDA